MTPGLQAAQAVHASNQFFVDWPSMARAWFQVSNFLVVVAVPDELALAELATVSIEEGIVRSVFREPDLGNTITAVALEPGSTAQRLCAQLPLALREAAMT